MERNPESVSPDVYAMLAPYIQDAVDSFSDEILYGMTPEQVSLLSDEALRRSGLLYCMPVCAGPLLELAHDITLQFINRRGHVPFDFRDVSVFVS